jgi:cation diffusion facilitator CzcD-associated flavoprotein CzcO
MTLKTDTQAAPAPTLPAHVSVAVIGSGFAGLGMAIRLRDMGIEDFVVLERREDLGGTWHDNTYPGCQCDVPSHLYSLSFAPNPEWTRTFSLQPEIHAYLQRVADDFDVRRFIRFGHEVTDATWDEDRARWAITTSHGSLEADVLVSGVGGLSEPSIPELPGIERFQGRTFHSAQWDHDYDLEGKRVAVVGTGASAIQFIPHIQPKVESMAVFQRTPPWVMPLRDRRITDPERSVYRRSRSAQLAMRAAIYWARETFVIGFMHPRYMEKMAGRVAKKYLEKSVPDPELRRKLTPDYTIGCKRVLISNDYYPSLAQPNVEVVTDGIREVRARSIVDASGVERGVDTIIYGTGFRVSDMPAANLVTGRTGRTLSQAFEGSPKAHRGTTFAEFPNLFMLVGPNTGLGHNSIVFMIESQINYILDALRYMDETGIATIEPRADVQQHWNERIDERLQGTVWNAGGCKSWYLDDTGRNSTLWPGFTWPFREATRRFEPAEYVSRSPARTREPVPALA